MRLFSQWWQIASHYCQSGCGTTLSHRCNLSSIRGQTLKKTDVNLLNWGITLNKHIIHYTGLYVNKRQLHLGLTSSAMQCFLFILHLLGAHYPNLRLFVDLQLCHLLVEFCLLRCLVARLELYFYALFSMIYVPRWKEACPKHYHWFSEALQRKQGGMPSELRKNYMYIYCLYEQMNGV